MIRAAEAAASDAKIAELKRLNLLSGQYETLEKLEDAVDAFMWADELAHETGDDPPLSKRPK